MSFERAVAAVLFAVIHLAFVLLSAWGYRYMAGEVFGHDLDFWPSITLVTAVMTGELAWRTRRSGRES